MSASNVLLACSILFIFYITDATDSVGASSAASTPVSQPVAISVDGGKVLSEHTELADSKLANDSGTCIVRHGRSSLGSTGSMGTLQGSTG